MDNGPGQIPGGYEEIVWNDLTLTHDVLVDSQGDAVGIITQILACLLAILKSRHQ